MLGFGIFFFINLNTLSLLISTSTDKTPVGKYQAIIKEKTDMEIDEFSKSSEGKKLIHKMYIYNKYFLRTLVSFAVGLLIGLITRKNGYILAPGSIAIFKSSLYFLAIMKYGIFAHLSSILASILHLLMAALGGYLGNYLHKKWGRPDAMAREKL